MTFYRSVVPRISDEYKKKGSKLSDVVAERCGLSKEVKFHLTESFSN